MRGRSERQWESDRASHTSTGGSNAFSQMAPRIGLSCPMCVRGRSDSHGLSLWPLTTKSCDLCGRPICEAGGGRPNLDSLIGLDRSHEKMWEAMCVGGRI